MSRPVAIVDTSFLVYCTLLKEVDLLNKIRILFDHILLPKEIIKEFTPKENRPENNARHQILGRIEINQGFYRHCTSLDHIIYKELINEKTIDAGEAEVISQSQHRGIRFILMDEKRALKNLSEKFSHIHFYNTITILAVLELQGFLPNYRDCIIGLHSIRKFSSKDLRDAFLKGMNYTQRNLSKKELSEKTSLKKILNTSKT
ncbi:MULTISPECIES: hypothetical protein [Roseivirga]|uniref:hypothetical protein n=1 Tax=Roseivirga TaxID=290180 RepID=UPI002B268FB4|nr:hypothetical protein [Roseivirga sp.]